VPIKPFFTKGRRQVCKRHFSRCPSRCLRRSETALDVFVFLAYEIDRVSVQPVFTV
jgi:hypothetical protein